MPRFLEPEEKLVYESSANYIGGHSKLAPEVRGTLVLTTKRFFFEGIVGSFRKKRSVILFDIKLSSINQVKIEKTGAFSKPTVTIVLRGFESTEQPSFQVPDEDGWEKAVASVRIGGLV